MAKLYPPTIENCAFYRGYIEIPFQNNMSVSSAQVKGYALRIKTISTNKEIINLKNGRKVDNKLYFHLDPYKEKLHYGEYYKVQVAYIDLNDIVGYYSSIAICRCSDYISNYKIYKDKYTPNKFYLQVSRGTNDVNDALYTYEFYLCKLKKGRSIEASQALTNKKLIEDFEKSYIKKNDFEILKGTGIKLFNLEEQTKKHIYEASFSFGDIYLDTKNRFQYFIIGKIKTVNGIELVTVPILIETIEGNLLSGLQAQNNYDYGYINIKNTNSIKGYLSKKHGNVYQPLTTLGKNQTFNDFCIEQGEIYTYILGKNKYCLNDIELAKDDGVTVLNSDQYMGKNVRADYEDMSLWDGEKLLRLKYNPQVSSFKTTRPEQKVETLGSQYPFVFYNMTVGYKEFPISAFISTEMDEKGWFMSFQKFNPRRETTESSHSIFYGHGKVSAEILATAKDMEAVQLVSQDNHDLASVESENTSKLLTVSALTEGDKDTTLVGYLDDTKPPEDVTFTFPGLEDSFIDVSQEYKNERTFRKAILDWLNNGKPKLFRSPQEGIYIVQIMGVSFSPNDQLSRKMSTVSMNAVEIAECNNENLIKYNLLRPKENLTDTKDTVIYDGSKDFSALHLLNFSE